MNKTSIVQKLAGQFLSLLRNLDAKPLPPQAITPIVAVNSNPRYSKFDLRASERLCGRTADIRVGGHTPRPRFMPKSKS